MALTTIDPTSALVVIDLQKGIVSAHTDNPATAVVKQATHLAWTPPPPGTAQLLLVVEDIDVPLAKPAVQCVALIDPASGHLGPGALDARQPSAGVRVLRSTIGRGYHGPAPIKGHGPHRYTFQQFALSTPVDSAPGTTRVDRARPRALLPAITAPVLDRGRLTGVFER
jgi:phosphatidylethanolamine-binding protein (PEBP) family uncharacterized protein